MYVSRFRVYGGGETRRVSARFFFARPSRGVERKQSGHLSRRVARSWRSARASRAERETSRRDAHLVADVHQPSAGIGGEEELDQVELACVRRRGGGKGERGIGASDLRKRGESKPRDDAPAAAAVCSSVRPSSSRYFTSFDASSSVAYSAKHATLPSAAFSSIETCEVKRSPPVRVFSTRARRCTRLHCTSRSRAAEVPRQNRSGVIGIFSLFRERDREKNSRFTPSTGRGRSFDAFSPPEDTWAKWPFITQENRCRARKPDTIYFTMTVASFASTTRRAFHASASVFAVPDSEVSEKRGPWFAHPAMPLGLGALCAVPGATSWCVFLPFFAVVNGYRIGTLRCRSTRDGFARVGRFPATRERARAFLAGKREEAALDRR